MTKKERSENIYRILTTTYPDARCTLNVGTPERFLFSNILSPQCSDVVVNKVVQKLWSKYPAAKDVAEAEISNLEQLVRPCGLQRVKSRNLMKSAKMLVEEYNGKLPVDLVDLDLLVQFPGIGRKTALVILSEAFGVTDGIIVDTHNIRIAGRVGLTVRKDAVGVENDLVKIIPENRWRMWSHLMVFHGRAVCTARNPKCRSCGIRSLCKYRS